VRDEVVRKSIGIPHAHHDDHGHHEPGHHEPGSHTAKHDAAPAADAAVDVGHPADRYLPFILSLFFYILFCNLLGAFPFLGSPTADTSVTGALAVMAFLYVVKCGSQQSGFVGFWKSLVPHMDLPGPMALILIPMLWVIEFVGLLIKHCVLAVRLFANMLGGHTVISVFLLFIAQSADHGSVWWLVTPASTIGQLAIGLLELFVAFLQAYVFSLLTSLFISMAVNPH
jgi:F-type H+-transporting ATPase subunit a